MTQAIAIKGNINLESIKEAIAARIDSAGFTTWVAPLGVSVYGECLNLVAQNQFTADYVRKEYGNILQDIAADFSLSLNVCVKGSEARPSANDNISREYIAPKQTANAACGFDSFIASDENMFALAACKKIASGNSSFSQLFISGASGCGKSFLLDCICNATNLNIVKMTGGQFVADFARALKEKTIFSFKDFCRNCDMFIMDDVCALAGKRATMDEFLQLILDLKNSNKKIVLTANCAPNALVGFDRRLQSLFASGLIIDVVGPNAYVAQKMLMQAGVDKDVSSALARNVSGDGHLINGIISKIKTYTELMGTRVDMNVASHLLGDLLEKNKTPLMMVKMMCEKMSISFEEICGNSRSRRLTRARQIMMCVLKKTTNLSLTEIGNVCGGRDHATVVYALNQIEKQKASDLILGAEIEDMIKACK